ncbi:redoxin family protein [Aureivirga sp. CE67]|uniref:redoxin family protein n=1 Tax=Aureivirga sp. CE67 TaxID=1788983 RepID=UPI0018CB0557|nr:redoxin family protein [Aureivirga sp. CE67]
MLQNLNDLLLIFRGEHLKRKNLFFYTTNILFGIFFPFITTLITFLNDNEIRFQNTINHNLFINELTWVLQPFLTFFLPTAIVLQTIRLSYIDHKNNGWDLMQVQGISKFSIFFGKFTFLLFNVLQIIIAFFAAYFICFFLYKNFGNYATNTDLSIPFEFVRILFFRICFASFYFTSFLYVLSLIIKKPIFSFLFGFSSIIVEMLLATYNKIYFWSPNYQLTHIDIFKDNYESHGLLFTENISFIFGITILIIGFFIYKYKKLRIAFKFAKKESIIVFSVLALSILSYSFISKPKHFTPHERTIISGEIFTDMDFKNVYLVDRFLKDTLTTIPVKNGKFHSEIKNLEHHYYNVYLDNKIPLNFYLNTKDSLNIQASIFKKQRNIIGVKGNGFFYTPELRAYFIDNIIRNPELAKQQNKIHKAFERGYSNLLENLEKDFMHIDNFKPNKEITERNKTLLNLQMLEWWNDAEIAHQNSTENKNLEKSELILKIEREIPENSMHILDNSFYRKRILNSYNQNSHLDALKMFANQKENGMFKDFFLLLELEEYFKNSTDIDKNYEILDFFQNKIENKKVHKKLANSLEIQKSLIPGSSIPNLQFKNLENEILDIESFKGKYIVIDFWASWCGPCKVESPIFQMKSEGYDEEEILFISISTDRNEFDWRNSISKKDEPHFLIDPKFEKVLSEKLNIKTIPRFMMLDKEGKIIYSELPRPSNDSFDILIKNVLKNDSTLHNSNIIK